MELFLQSNGFCVYGEDPCPQLLEHCYEVASEELIGDWKADDRIERSIAWKREKRRLHAAPQIRKRGPWDTIRREQFLADRPLFQIVAVGVNAFTQKRVAQVEIPGLRLTIWVNLSGLKVSKNRLRKLARYKRGAVPKEIAAQVEDRVKAQVARFL